MVMPCATISSRTSVDGRPLIVGAVAGHVDHPLQAAKAAFGEQVAGELQGAGDRGAARAVRRIGGQLVDEGLRILGRGNHRPRHDDVLRGLPGPFDIGDGDPAVDAVLDRLDDALMGQRRGIALALDLQFVRRHRKRDVDGQDQFDVDRLGGERRHRRPRGRAPAAPRAVSPRRRKAGTTMPTRIAAKRGQARDKRGSLFGEHRRARSDLASSGGSGGACASPLARSRSPLTARAR